MADLSKNTLLFAKERRRMCTTVHCADCELSVKKCTIGGVCVTEEEEKKILQVVQEWSDAHPLRTYAKDFFEKFPDAEKDYDSCPCTCRKLMYGEESTNCERFNSCIECWNSPMEET